MCICKTLKLLACHDDALVCCLGRMTCKIVSEMTYIVSIGTLNPAPIAPVWNKYRSKVNCLCDCEGGTWLITRVNCLHAGCTWLYVKWRPAIHCCQSYISPLADWQQPLRPCVPEPGWRAVFWMQRPLGSVRDAETVYVVYSLSVMLRVTTCVENLETSGSLTAVRDLFH